MMNLRPNLWTLLFVIAAGAFFYVLSNTKAPATTPTATATPSAAPNAVLLQDTISMSHATSRILGYMARVSTKIQTENISQDAGVVNADVRYFQLPINELQSMASEFGRDTVWAYLSVIGTTMRQDTVDLIFTNEPLPDKLNNSQTAKFFDFSRPCPPTCPD